MTDRRPIDLPAALLLATAALALPVAAGAAFLLVAVVGAAGRDAVALDAGWAAGCAGAASIALLLVLTRAALHPAALAAAGALAAAWPLAGALAALPALLAIALVVHLGARPAALPHALPVAALCAALAFACLAVAPAARHDARAARHDPVARAATVEQEPREERDTAARGDASRGGARAAVRAYYGALDRRAFGTAWRTLSPAVRRTFGGFATWRAGFAATLSSRPEALAVSVDGDAATVTHRLVARDRAACGVATRRFTVRWQLARTPAGWRALTVAGTPDGGIRCG